MRARKSKARQRFLSKNFALVSELFIRSHLWGEQTGSCLALFPWKLKHEGDKLLLRHFQVGDRYTVSQRARGNQGHSH